MTQRRGRWRGGGTCTAHHAEEQGSVDDEWEKGGEGKPETRQHKAHVHAPVGPNRKKKGTRKKKRTWPSTDDSGGAPVHQRQARASQSHRPHG